MSDAIEAIRQRVRRADHGWAAMHHRAYWQASVDFAAHLGWRVIECNLVRTFGERERNTTGGVTIEDRTIYIKRGMARHERLLVLLHELGHAVAFERGYRDGGEIGHCAAETRAYLYGWAVALRLGIPINAASWRASNWEVWEPDVCALPLATGCEAPP